MLENGKIVLSGSGQELMASDSVKKRIWVADWLGCPAFGEGLCDLHGPSPIFWYVRRVL